VGDRVSFFVIAGDNSDEIYEGYRQLTGITPMLPKATYGYIQSKAIYPTQDQLMAVAKGYRDRNLPLDVLVVDFLNMTKQGELDLDPVRWPDPVAMNKQLHSMGITTLLSVWPHFAPGTRYYDMLRQKGWLIHTADGTPDFGGFKDVIGPNIDTDHRKENSYEHRSNRPPKTGPLRPAHGQFGHHGRMVRHPTWHDSQS